MKYYLYISDAKVDMLFPQVPHDIKKKVATEWKMDLKVLSASRRVETEGDDNRIARLETVVDFIREYGNVGTVDEPDEYISDTMPMRWGTFNLELVPTFGPAVYFAGETEQTLIGMGGSSRHLIGASGSSFDGYHSGTPTLLGFFRRELENIYVNDERELENSLGIDGFTPLDVVGLVVPKTQGPSQNVEFVAKRLLHGPHPTWDAEALVTRETYALLASPLYVAMAD